MGPGVKLATVIFALAAAGATYFKKPIYQTLSQTVYGKICGVNADFDFAIVGAGTSGAIAAYELSANPNFCVLLDGDGGDPATLTGTDTIGLAPHFCLIPSFPPPWPVVADMAYSYETTDGTNPMQSYIWKNKIRGGASAWNTGVIDSNDCAYYNAINAAYPDSIAAGFTCANVQATFAALTTFKAPAGYPIKHGVNGQNGPFVVQVWNPEPATNIWIQGVSNVTGIPAPANFNVNAGPGVGTVQRSIDTVNGQFVRQQTFTQFITATGIWNAQGTGSRPNLVVRDYVTVKRLLSVNISGEAVFYGYEYDQAANLPGSPDISGTLALKPGGQIILAAGQPSTLSLLQLSGIGNCTYLRGLPSGGIDCAYHNPSVGNETQNTQGIAMIFVIKVPAPERVNCNSQNAYWPSELAKSLGETLEDISIGSVYFLPATWPGSSDPTLYSSILVLPAIYRNRGNPIGQFGTHRIRDGDSRTKPSVAFNTNPEGFVEAVKKARAACTYINNVLGIGCVETDPGLIAVPNVDAAIAAWSASVDFNDFAHMYSGAAMGGADRHGVPKSGAVVDSHLRVYGVKNVRVVDLSVWPGSAPGYVQIPKHSYHYSAMISGAIGAQIALRDYETAAI